MPVRDALIAGAVSGSVVEPSGRGARYPWLALVLSAAVLALSGHLLTVACRAQASLGLKTSTDLLLAGLPLFDATAWLSYGWLALHAAALTGALLFERRRLPYFLASLALLMLVRDAFLALTPVGPPDGMVKLYTGSRLPFMNGVAYDNEIFFSGHAGTPFLYFLMWRRPGWLRWSFLAVSLANAFGVLLTRNHYAIDVLGAFFITHSVHVLSRSLFARLDPERVLSAA